MSDQLVSVIGDIIGAVSLFLTLLQFRRRRRHRRTVWERSWKFCGIEHTPSLRQSRELFAKVIGFLKDLEPPLAETFRRNAVDPLTALARIRGALRAHRSAGGGSFAIPVYDGARRFDIVGRMLPQKAPSDGTLRVELTLRPIAGFKGETSEDGDPDSAPRKVDLRVTDDARLMPLSITVPVFFLPLVVQLDHFCPSAEACPG
jgi:hypothetical protein